MRIGNIFLFGYLKSVIGTVSHLTVNANINQSCLAILLKKLPRVSSALDKNTGKDALGNFLSNIRMERMQSNIRQY